MVKSITFELKPRDKIAKGRIEFPEMLHLLALMGEMETNVAMHDFRAVYDSSVLEVRKGYWLFRRWLLGSGFRLRVPLAEVPQCIGAEDLGTARDMSMLYPRKSYSLTSGRRCEYIDVILRVPTPRVRTCKFCLYVMGQTAEEEEISKRMAFLGANA